MSDIAIPQVVERLALTNPYETWVRIPKDPDLTQGWKDVTYQDLAVAVDGLCYWIEKQIGVGDGRVVAYMGLNDPRFVVAIVALIKTGYRALLPSLRNSRDGQAAILDRTDCNILLHGDNIDLVVDATRSARPRLKVLQVPGFDTLLQLGRDASGPFVSRNNTAADHRVLILHTSGSTGHPKPISFTNESIATYRTLRNQPNPSGRPNTLECLFPAGSGQSVFTMAPFFHVMGCAVILGSLLNRVSVIQLPPERPINAQLIVDAIQQTRPNVGVFAPSILEQIAREDQNLKALSCLDYVFFGGAPLDFESGERISTVTRVLSCYGSTEMGFIPTILIKDPRDWQYIDWAPIAGTVMEPDAGEFHELVIKRDPKLEAYQTVFMVFPELSEWRTSDLWSAHPEHKNLWKYRGRKDDIIVLNNGEKFNPVILESVVASHPWVRGALAVGQGQFQTALIIEPRWDAMEPKTSAADIIEAVWPSVEQANAASPTHAKVWRSKVAVASREKSFLRTPKGSIQRLRTIELFQPEIDALYGGGEDPSKVQKLDPAADVDQIKKYLRETFTSKGLAIPTDADDNADLFGFGVDSLQVLALASALSNALPARQVAPKDVYSHPTIESLARWIKSPGSPEGESTVGRADAMQAMVNKYIQDFMRPVTVVVTGTTGSLGNYILQALLNDMRVSEVYCLNRSADAEARQKHSFEARGAAADFQRVKFIQADFGREHFGLPSAVYHEMLERVDIIIHNAWAVDFNKTLASYEGTHIAGTRRCVNFSLESKKRAQVVFISSIASVGNWREDYPVPEKMMHDDNLPLPGQGYGESKHVASRILEAASAQAGVPSTIIRTGQLAGPSDGGIEWNRHEWLPSLVISSAAMQVLPDKLGNSDNVDWVALDDAGKTVVEVALARQREVAAGGAPCSVAHLTNPRTIKWERLAPAVAAHIEKMTGKSVEVMSFEQWLSKLREVQTTTEDAKRVPAVKLRDFYEGLAFSEGGLPPLATERTVRISPTLGSMKAVDEELMTRWMQSWFS
ncbi:acetyl-CoA synthetase-like protein [Piedraia hortae CBS 480.64]|uniref:Acetyl-CoA synthetase-like protein n=1 Tax=Piedraia hortae CBS 480.64 TaxID=1314780 RepID=A0A6A7BYL1_9PEZI|nr:acetyl-CoA synthetase-like protein [Piedraia hortae CBS 480.64]